MQNLNSQQKLLIVDEHNWSLQLETWPNHWSLDNFHWVSSTHEAFKRLSVEQFDMVFCDDRIRQGEGEALVKEILRTQSLDQPLVWVHDDRHIKLDQAHRYGASHLVDRDILFQMPSLVEIAPRTLYALEHFQDDGAVQLKASSEHLGRGGFVYNGSQCEGLERGQSVEFDLKLEFLPDTQLKGVGRISWQSLEGIGVEFQTLYPESAELREQLMRLFLISSYIR